MTTLSNEEIGRRFREITANLPPQSDEESFHDYMLVNEDAIGMLVAMSDEIHEQDSSNGGGTRPVTGVHAVGPSPAPWSNDPGALRLGTLPPG